MAMIFAFGKSASQQSATVPSGYGTRISAHGCGLHSEPRSRGRPRSTSGGCVGARCHQERLPLGWCVFCQRSCVLSWGLVVAGLVLCAPPVELVRAGKQKEAFGIWG